MSKTKIKWFLFVPILLAAILAYFTFANRSGTGSTQRLFDSLIAVPEMSGLPIEGRFRWERPLLSRTKVVVSGYISKEKFGSWLADPEEARVWQNSQEMWRRNKSIEIIPYRKQVSHKGITALLHVDVATGHFQLQEYASH